MRSYLGWVGVRLRSLHSVATQHGGVSILLQYLGVGSGVDLCQLCQLQLGHR